MCVCVCVCIHICMYNTASHVACLAGALSLYTHIAHVFTNSFLEMSVSLYLCVNPRRCVSLSPKCPTDVPASGCGRTFCTAVCIYLYFQALNLFKRALQLLSKRNR